MIRSDLLNAMLPEMTAIRRDLHAHPELGYAETRTCGVVQRESAGDKAQSVAAAGERTVVSR